MDPVTLVPELLYAIAILLALLPFVPLPVSFAAYLVSFHLDLSGPSFPSATAFGLANAVRTVVIPDDYHAGQTVDLLIAKKV